MTEKNIYKTGTTTIGIVAKDGIVLASDTKGTMGHLAANDNVSKIFKINDNLAVTIAGGVGDAMFLVRHLRNQANLYELEHKKPLNVKSCSTLLSNILNTNKMIPFFTQFIIAGNKEELTMYTLDMGGGMIEEKNTAVTGSGSELALSVLDNEYKSSMTSKEAVELAKKAITSAKKRDIFSGGEGINVLIIKKDKIETLPIFKYK